MEEKRLPIKCPFCSLHHSMQRCSGRCRNTVDSNNLWQQVANVNIAIKGFVRGCWNWGRFVGEWFCAASAESVSKRFNPRSIRCGGQTTPWLFLVLVTIARHGSVTQLGCISIKSFTSPCDGQPLSSPEFSFVFTAGDEEGPQPFARYVQVLWDKSANMIKSTALVVCLFIVVLLNLSGKYCL